MKFDVYEQNSTYSINLSSRFDEKIVRLQMAEWTKFRFVLRILKTENDKIVIIAINSHYNLQIFKRASI